MQSWNAANGSASLCELTTMPQPPVNMPIAPDVHEVVGGPLCPLPFVDLQVGPHHGQHRQLVTAGLDELCPRGVDRVQFAPAWEAHADIDARAAE